MISLALDTATLTGSVAVLRDDLALAELSARVRATHSEQLLVLVEEALARAGVSLDEVERLAVGVGPGSFTGVRIGLATAKGLALSTGAPLVGVSSLAALAASLALHGGPVLACLDARRDEVYAEGFGEGLATVMPALHASPESVGARALSALAGVITVVGDLDDALRGRLASSAPERFVFVTRALATPLARFVSVAASARGVVDDGSLEPIYLRGSDAKVPASMIGAS